MVGWASLSPKHLAKQEGAPDWMHASTRSGCKTLRQRERGIITATVKIALDDGVALFVLTIHERAIILAALEDHPTGSPSSGPCSSGAKIV